MQDVLASYLLSRQQKAAGAGHYSVLANAPDVTNCVHV